MIKIKLLDGIVEITKKKAKSDDSNVAYIQTKKGLQVLLFAGIEEYQQKMALETFRFINNNPEMVFVANVWWLPSIDKKEFEKGKVIRPRDNPNRKEAFFVSYFSKELEATTVLHYKTVDGKIEWLKEEKNWEMESSFNPYKFKKEDIKEWLERSKIDSFKQKAEVEERKICHLFKVKIYRKYEKIAFEVINQKGEIFFATGIEKATNEFNSKLDIVISALNGNEEAMNKLKYLIKKGQK